MRWFDVNAYLGHWPFRRLPQSTADELLRLMDAESVEMALVSSASGILRKNVQPANDDLAADIAGHRERLLPLAVVNPAYPGWERDLSCCVEDHGFRGVRLYPSFHGYDLTDSRLDELVSAASDYSLVVAIVIRPADSRQRHWLVDAPDVSLDALSELVRRHPHARFILVNGMGYTRCPLGAPGSDMPDNYVIETSRLSALLRSEMAALIGGLGSRRLVYGSGMPFKYVGPAQLKVEVVEASLLTRQRIAYDNAVELLGLMLPVPVP